MKKALIVTALVTAALVLASCSMPIDPVTTDDSSVQSRGPSSVKASSVVDLSKWFIDLPYNSSYVYSDKYDAINKKPSQLATWVEPTSTKGLWAASDKSYISIYCPWNASHYGTSTNPRSEFKQMKDDSNRESWSTSSSDKHWIEAYYRVVTHTTGKNVCFVQVHDTNDDVIEYQLVKNSSGGYNIVVKGEYVPSADNGKVIGTVAANTWFKFRVFAQSGYIKAYLNGSSTAAYVLKTSRSDCYFKTGVYLQTSPTSGACQIDIKAATLKHGVN